MLLPRANNLQIHIFTPDPFLSFKLSIWHLYIDIPHALQHWSSAQTHLSCFISDPGESTSSPSSVNLRIVMITPSTSPHPNNSYLYWVMLTAYYTPTFASPIPRKLWFCSAFSPLLPSTQPTCFFGGESHHQLQGSPNWFDSNPIPLASGWFRDGHVTQSCENQGEVY